MSDGPGAKPRSGTELAAVRVADALRRSIIEGDLRSGAPLREASIAAGLDVSRNSVREGFRLLAREGLVVHEQHRGVRVRRLTPDDVTDIYRVRRTVELLGLPLLDAAGLTGLAATVADAYAAAAIGDWRAVSTADLRFHQQIAAAAGSPRFDAMFVALLAELRLAFAVQPDGRRFHAPYLERNALIVELLESGDVQAATAELDGYLRDAEAELRSAIQLIVEQSLDRSLNNS